MILLSLGIVAVFFYVKGRHTNTASIEPFQPSQVKLGKSRPVDETRWYKQSYQNASKELQSLVQQAPLNVTASKDNLNSYEQIVSQALSSDNALLAAFASQKIAELNPSDSNYLKAGDYFMRELGRDQDEEKSRFLLVKGKQLYKKATEQNPDNILANNRLAVAIIQLNEDPPMVGIGYIKKSLSIDSNDLSTNILYGELLILSGQNEKAIKVYNKLVNLQPSNANFHFKLSDLFGQLGREDKAKEHLEKAKKLNQQ